MTKPTTYDEHQLRSPGSNGRHWGRKNQRPAKIGIGAFASPTPLPVWTGEKSNCVNHLNM